MTQLYVLSQDGTSAINLSQFEYVYIGEDNRIKAVNGQKMIRLGDYKSRDGAKFALATMLYYAGKNPGAGWYQMMRGDAAEEHVVRSRDPAPNQFAAIIDEHGTAAGIAEMQRRLDGICLTEMRVPLNRNTKNRREVELRMAADQTVTAMWCCFALAIHQTLGFGRDRLNRLHKETVENYRQFNEWNGSGSRDEQQYAFERLRHCAEQALRSEVVIVQENDDYDSRARLWERQLEDSIKAGVHKAKVETKRKARVNALATNVLSDAARQQAALKVQQDFFGGGYR